MEKSLIRPRRRKKSFMPTIEVVSRNLAVGGYHLIETDSGVLGLYSTESSVNVAPLVDLQAFGAKLERGFAWALGDSYNLGQAALGDEFNQFVKLHTVQNYASVCSAFPFPDVGNKLPSAMAGGVWEVDFIEPMNGVITPVHVGSMRWQKLSIGHHEAVAVLSNAERAKLLNNAYLGNWSVSDIRSAKVEALRLRNEQPDKSGFDIQITRSVLYFTIDELEAMGLLAGEKLEKAKLESPDGNIRVEMKFIAEHAGKV